MNRSNQRKLTDLAVSILSQQPSHRVEAFSGDGGVVALELQSQDGAYVLADAPRLRVRPMLELLVRTHDEGGGGHDITFIVADVVRQTEWTAAIQLRVIDVQRRETVRTTPRAALADLALVRVTGARAIAADDEFDVRLADLSASGVAFVTDRTFHVGDCLAMMATISSRVLRLQARVLQTSLSHYGRQRVGCEILQIPDEDRRRISALTTERPHTGTAEQRLRRTA
jgi:hypothetical protein